MFEYLGCFVRIELSARTGRQSGGVSLVERVQNVGVLFVLGAPSSSSASSTSVHQDIADKHM